MKDKTNHPAVLFWDLEISLGINFDASLSTLFCFGHMYKDWKKAKVLKLSDYPGYSKTPWDDYKLVKDVRDILEEADEWVYWFGDRFDWPYINTKLLLHNLPPLPVKQRNDMWRTAKEKFKLRNNRLDTFAGALAGHGKASHDLQDWKKASGGNKPALKRIADYCAVDVELMIPIYEKFKPYNDRTINLSLFNDDILVCPKCGSDKLRHKGYRYTAHSKFKRWHCKGCGYYPTSRCMEKQNKETVKLK